MKPLLYVAAGAIGLAALVGCGPNCQNTCDQVYSVCGITKTGQTTRELVQRCVTECDAAMQQAGELGDYQPEARRSSAVSIELENEVQAAAWMDCVWNHAPDGTPEQCADLDPSSGFCAPI